MHDFVIHDSVIALNAPDVYLRGHAVPFGSLSVLSSLLSSLSLAGAESRYQSLAWLIFAICSDD